MKISLCLLVWNELEGCKLDVPRLPREAFEEVFAIDGGSTDGTVEYLRSQNIPVHTQTKKGLNAAYIQANQTASGDAVVAYFPKGAVPVEDLLRFRPFLEAGNALVVASRQIDGAVNEEDSHFLRPRKWAVWSLAALASLVWRREGYWVRDVLHGVKGWTRSSFDAMNIVDHGLSIDIEMVVRSYKLRFKRVEFPTRESPRTYGTSHFKFLPTGKKLLRYLWYEARRPD